MSPNLDRRIPCLREGRFPGLSKSSPPRPRASENTYPQQSLGRSVL